MAIEQRPQPPGPQVQAASMTTATTGLVIWIAEDLVFRGTLPGSVHAFLQLGIPWLCGVLAARMTYRRAIGRLDCR